MSVHDSSVRAKSEIPFRKKLPSVFTYTEAIGRSLFAQRLYAYRDQGIIEQIGRGLYRWADAPEIDQNLLEIAYRIPARTLCLSTALARHGLTDNIPARIDVAIPRGNVPISRRTGHPCNTAQRSRALVEEEQAHAGWPRACREKFA